MYMRECGCGSVTSISVSLGLQFVLHNFWYDAGCMWNNELIKRRDTQMWHRSILLPSCVAALHQQWEVITVSDNPAWWLRNSEIFGRSYPADWQLDTVCSLHALLHVQTVDCLSLICVTSDIVRWSCSRNVIAPPSYALLIIIIIANRIFYFLQNCKATLHV